MVEHLLRIYKALGSVPSTTATREGRGREDRTKPRVRVYVTRWHLNQGFEENRILIKTVNLFSHLSSVYGPLL